MAKQNEINYLKLLTEVDGIDADAVTDYHLRKPFSDSSRFLYLMDLSQILKLMPQPPARVLDAGIGSGWTSRAFAMSGYSVVGVDISPDMIELAKELCNGVPNIQFHALDCETPFDYGLFDCVVIYEALHHADDPGAVVKNFHRALKPGGRLITIEPGRGHAEACKEIMEKYGTTEKDMDFSIQREILLSAGFSRLEKYPRLSILNWYDLNSSEGEQEQHNQFIGALYNIRELGLSTIVVAIK